MSIHYILWVTDGCRSYAAKCQCVSVYCVRRRRHGSYRLCPAGRRRVHGSVPRQSQSRRRTSPFSFSLFNNSHRLLPTSCHNHISRVCVNSGWHLSNFFSVFEVANEISIRYVWLGKVKNSNKIRYFENINVYCILQIR